MRYIVTGGAGFIGSNLADTLAQHHDVVIIDNLATGRRVNIERLLDHPRVTFVEGSITDLDLLMDTFPGADGIFHQAAIPSVPRSVKDPLASNEANVTWTLDVLVVVTVRCRPWFVDLDLWRLPSFEIMQSSRSPNAA